MAGITCRFYSSHPDQQPSEPAPAAEAEQQQPAMAIDTDIPVGGWAGLQEPPESIQPPVNNLRKDVQHKLWKNTWVGGAWGARLGPSRVLHTCLPYHHCLYLVQA